MRGTRLCCALLLLAPGCGGAPSRDDARWSRLPPAPCVVRIVLPAALGDAAPPPEKLEGALPIDPARLARTIRTELERRRVCTEVDVVDEAASRSDASSASASPAGKDDSPADLLLTIEAPSPPTYAFSRRTGWFLPNTLLWFFAGFPSFWVADRVYGIHWDVRFRLGSIPGRRELRDVPHPLHDERALNVAERGWTAQVLYTPPGLYEGPDTARVLASQVESWLAGQLAAFVKGEAASLPFDVDIEIESPVNLALVGPAGLELRARIRSPAVLERLRVELDGEAIFERDALTMMKASRSPRPGGGSSGESGGGSGRYEYALKLPLDATGGEHRLRVLALRSGEAGPGAAAGAGGASVDWSASSTVGFRVGAAPRA